MSHGLSTSQKSAGLQVCKSASLQVCKSASLQVCKSASLQVCKSASLQVCKSASLQVCKSASLQVCSLQVSHTGLACLFGRICKNPNQISGRHASRDCIMAALLPPAVRQHHMTIKNTEYKRRWNFERWMCVWRLWRGITKFINSYEGTSIK